MTKDDLTPVEQVEDQVAEREPEQNTDVPAPDKDSKQDIDERPPIPRKHVTDIVRRERLDAFNKGKLAAMEELKAQAAQAAEQPAQSFQQPMHQPNSVGLGGMAAVTPEQVAKMISDATQQMHLKHQQDLLAAQQKQDAQMVVGQFNSQMSAGKLKYPDFDEKIKEVHFGNMPEIVKLAADTGKAADIMYDLAENPQKITHLMILAHTQPALAAREMQKLANSIQQNQEAAKQTQPRDHLDTITPSTVDTDSGDMSNMSVSDFRKMFI